MIRLTDREQQLRAQAVLARELGDGFIVALNLAPTTPEWLVQGGAAPMKLGLDLSGGVHFKLEVDAEAAAERKLSQYETGIKKRLREERIRGRVSLDGGQVAMQFRTEADREAARREARAARRESAPPLPPLPPSADPPPASSGKSLAGGTSGGVNG